MKLERTTTHNIMKSSIISNSTKNFSVSNLSKIYIPAMKPIAPQSALLSIITTSTPVPDMIVLLLSIIVISITYLLHQRYTARMTLQRKAQLPTTTYMPRFFNYNLIDIKKSHEERKQKLKLSSSNITGILPRMNRLKGPYGLYGTIYGFRTPVVHIAHPHVARLVLCDNTSGRTKSPAYDHFKNFSGEGVFTADDEDWKEKRTSVVHCLMSGVGSKERLEREVNRAYEDLALRLEQEFLSKNEMVEDQNRLNKSHTDQKREHGRLNKSHTDQKREHGIQTNRNINIVSLLQKSTVSIIYRFLTHDDDDTTHNSPITTTDNNNNNNNKNKNNISNYLLSINRIRMIILAQSRSIWFLLPRRLYTLFSPTYRHEERTMTFIRSFARLAVTRAKPLSPLGMLQTMCRQNSNQRRRRRRSHCSEKDVLDEAITLLFAGQDTSAATLSWTLHLLSLHPEVQSRLQAEVDGNNNNKGVLSRGDVSSEKMPYLDAVIRESQRLFPVAPFVVRRVVEDLVVDPPPYDDVGEERTIVLPKGCFACVWIYGLHRHPEFWNHPERFDPERWLRDDDKVDRGRRKGAFLPFATGPRNCLGRTLAQIILKIMLARIIRDYFIEDGRTGDEKGTLKEMQAGFTVLPVGGVDLILTRRMQGKKDK